MTIELDENFFGNYGFTVGYEIVSDVSCINGDVESCGIITKAADFETAIELVNETELNSLSIESIEFNCSEIQDSSWIIVQHSPCIKTGKAETRTLHFLAGFSNEIKQAIYDKVVNC